jgi:hypothetical protein
MSRQNAIVRIRVWSQEKIDPDQQERFAELAQSELMYLHAENFARYQVRPSEFAAWQRIWAS